MAGGRKLHAERGMVRSFRYPLHPTQIQDAILVAWLGACCDLYNGALQERRDAWRRFGRGVSFNDQCASLTEIRATVDGWKNIPCEVARSALRRLDRAFAAFFRRCQRGEKPGYPRFRAKARYDSFGLGPKAQRDHAIGTLVRDGRVAIPKLGLVKFHEYRPLRGKVLDVIVRREAGRWYVVFQCDLGAAPPKVDPSAIPPERQVGVDVGLAALATLSTGESVANPRHGREAAKLLAARQRSLARKLASKKRREAMAGHRLPDGNNLRQARRLVQQAHAHVRNQRLDTARKAAASLVSRFDLICLEDLAVARMVHGNLAFSIHDAAWRMLIDATACKAEGAGKLCVKSDPAGTTIACSGCGEPVPKGLGERIHRCPRCGLVLCRDVNAARNVLARGRRAIGLPPMRVVTEKGAAQRVDAGASLPIR